MKIVNKIIAGIILIIIALTVAWIGYNYYSDRVELENPLAAMPDSVMEYKVSGENSFENIDYSQLPWPSGNTSYGNLTVEQIYFKNVDEFMRYNNLLPSDAVNGHIYVRETLGAYDPVNKTEFSMVKSYGVRYDRIINGLEVYGPGQQLQITVGTDGTISGIGKSWPDVILDQMVKIKTSSQAYSDLMNGNYIMRTKNLAGITITNVSLGYYMGTGENVDPIYVFQGFDRHNPPGGTILIGYVNATAIA